MFSLKPYDVPLDRYESLIGGREYWDSLSHEWSYSTLEEKIVRLAGFVQMGGNLKKVVNHYAKRHDEMYRSEIQNCVLLFIIRLLKKEENTPTEYIPVRRIKRLDKNHLIILLKDLLKHSVKKSYEMDSSLVICESWIIKYDRKYSPDMLLDKIDKKQWKANPNESFTSFLNRSEYWWDGVHSLW